MRLLVHGAGGHAKVVIDTARAAGVEVVAVLGTDDDPASLLGVPVVRDAEAVDADAVFVAIGRNALRKRVFETYRERGVAVAALVHPSAIVAADVEVGAGTLVAPGAIINVGARIGENVIVNTGCRIDHDCVIGAHSHVGPGASLCGGCGLGEGVLMGTGSCAIPLRRIGAWSVIGAGAAVTEDLPDRMVCVGVPARPLHAAGEE